MGTRADDIRTRQTAIRTDLDNLEQVEERRKEIQYSSRTRMGVETFRNIHTLRRHRRKWACGRSTSCTPTDPSRSGFTVRVQRRAVRTWQQRAE